MKGKFFPLLAATILWAQFGSVGDANAYKPKAPFCYQTGQPCGIPAGNISADPQTVHTPSSSATGTTRLTWKWDFESGGPSFQHACIYVRVNYETDAHKVQCEWPGNTLRTDISWIAAGFRYTFTLAPNQGSTVNALALNQLAGSSSVVVNGVYP